MSTEEISHVLPSGIRLDIKITLPDSPEPEPEPVEPEPEPEPQQRMFIGQTPEPTEFDLWHAEFPNSAISRVFSKTDPPPWADKRIQALFEWGQVPFISWKIYDEAKVLAWLQSIPEGKGIAATWMHEPEPKNVNPTEYKEKFKKLYDLIKSHPNGDRVLFGPVLTRQWTENKVGNTYDIYDPKCGDFIGCDMYANTWENRYPNVEEFTRYWGQYCMSNAGDRAVWVPELGAVKMESDATGNYRAGWIVAVHDALFDWGIDTVIWWNADGTPSADGQSRNFRLSDEPSKQAFRQVLAKFNGNA